VWWCSSSSADGPSPTLDDVLDALSPQRRRLVLIAAGLGLALLLVVVLTVVIRSVRGFGPAAPQDQPGPVLLVPGYGGNADSLAPLEVALRAAGRQVVVVTPAGDGTGDLRAEADHLADVAASTLDRTGAPSVDVIGYSAGGVVARLWVRDGNGKTAARRVLTLGSPHHGTGVAQLGSELASANTISKASAPKVLFINGPILSLAVCRLVFTINPIQRTGDAADDTQRQHLGDANRFPF